MSDPTQQPSSETTTEEQNARREFLQRVGKATASAPAVALLMAASFESANAQQAYGPTGGSGSS